MHLIEVSDHQQEIIENMPDLHQDQLETRGLNDLGPDWYPALISLSLGVCIYAKEGQHESRLCLRLISAVAKELEKENEEKLTFGAK